MRLVSWSSWVFVAVLAVAAALLAARDARTGAVAAGDAQAGATRAFAWGDAPVALTIDWVSDCTADRPDRVPPTCGAPPALWNAPARLVGLCTLQGQRPAWWTADQFRAAVQAAADDWNVVEAAVGINFQGDCVDQSRWECRTPNGVNAVAFDDARNLLVASACGNSPNALAITFSAMTLQGGVRVIREADVLLGSSDFVQQCPAVVLRHEFGHVLGFGHSDQPGDLMAAAPPAPLQICARQPGASEQALLQQMYGVNRRPAVSISPLPPVAPGAPVVLNAVAADPEGGALTFEWAQVRGVPVALTPSGPALSFAMPAQAGGDLAFRVVVRDALLKPASASAVVSSGAAGSFPRVLGGAVPTAGGFGLIVFSGGNEAELLAATCGTGAASTAAFWATNAQGQFVVYIPNAAVAAVNAGWRALHPQGVPASSALLVRCR